MTLTTDPSIETPAPTPQQWRSAELSEVLKALEASEQGLSEAAAAARLRSFGSNSIVAHTRRALVTELALRFGNPLILLLLAASLIAAVTGDTKSALIIVLVVSASVLLDFFRSIVPSAPSNGCTHRLPCTARCCARAQRGRSRSTPWCRAM
jgi:P-type Mg2+ transporter